MTKEAEGDSVWVELKLDKTQFIQKVVIYQNFYTDFYWPTNWCVRSEHIYRSSCKNIDTGVEVSVNTGGGTERSCGTMDLSYKHKQEDQIYTFSCNGNGDTVRLSKTSGRIRINEIVVTGTGNVGVLQLGSTIAAF